jgi:hypothetical protein
MRFVIVQDLHIAAGTARPWRDLRRDVDCEWVGERHALPGFGRGAGEGLQRRCDPNPDDAPV